MNKNELSQAFDLARSKADLSQEDDSVFMGFGLPDFKPVYVTIGQVARLIRWQCGQFNGGWDSHNLQQIAFFGRKRFTIIGAPIEVKQGAGPLIDKIMYGDRKVYIWDVLMGGQKVSQIGATDKIEAMEKAYLCYLQGMRPQVA